MIDPGLEPGLCEPRAGVLSFPSAQLYTEHMGLHWSGAVSEPIGFLLVLNVVTKGALQGSLRIELQG